MIFFHCVIPMSGSIGYVRFHKEWVQVSNSDNFPTPRRPGKTWIIAFLNQIKNFPYKFENFPNQIDNFPNLIYNFPNQINNFSNQIEIFKTYSRVLKFIRTKKDA